MSSESYLPMFLAETREHLERLDQAILRVEADPTDRDTVDEIFRIAHSLKGMSATMGFSAMAALCHQMEDVFELLRQRRGGLSRDAIDVCLASLDALTACLAGIEAGEGETLEPDELIGRLKRLVRRRSPEQQAARVGGEADLHAVTVKAAGRPVQQVVVRLADEAQMPAVRAFMVLQAIAAGGELLLSIPALEAVEVFEGRELRAYVVDAGEEAVAALVAAAREIADVAEASAAPWTAAQAPAVTRPVAPAEPSPAVRAAPTVRVDASRLDGLMHLMGEVVVARTRVEAMAARLGDAGLGEACEELSRASHELQAMVMQVRMMPVEAVMLRLPRLVRDLSSKLGKQVDLRMAGQDTELDRTVVDALGDPLVHLVRNALDHGFEPPEERTAAGKPEHGTLTISAAHAGGNIVLTVADDGRGIDPERIARQAARRGIIGEDDVVAVDQAAAVELLFAPGFSTAEEAGDVSGRGVGMDVVRTTVRELGGDVSIDSELGRGTTATIRLPLTLAIVGALVVELGDRPFALPLNRVERTLKLSPATTRAAAGRRVVVHDGEVVPLVDGRSRYGLPPGDDDHAVVVRSRGRLVALTVSRLVGQQELVTRPLPAAAADGAVAGGAVLADGTIALIVDCDRLEAPSPGPVALVA